MSGITHRLVDRKTDLCDWLASEEGISRERAALLLWLGAIYVNKTRCREDTALNPGDYLRLHFNPKRFQGAGLIRILKETNDFIVIDKPSGLPTHPTLDNAVENAKCFLEDKLACPLFAPQRLDISTSGVLLFAKNREFLQTFNAWQSDGVLKKYYVAVSSRAGRLPRLGRWTHFMENSKRSPKKISSLQIQNWKVCHLDVLEANESGRFCRLRIQLLTGRTHQIRAQLAFEGFPILGDRLYGSPFRSDGTFAPAAGLTASPNASPNKVPSDPPIALRCTGLEFPGEKFSLQDDGCLFGQTL